MIFINYVNNAIILEHFILFVSSLYQFFLVTTEANGKIPTLCLYLNLCLCVYKIAVDVVFFSLQCETIFQRLP